MPSQHTFTILLLGNRGVGKSSFITRHKTGEFYPQYDSNNTVVTTRLDFATNYGPLRFIIKEAMHYVECDAVIIMFDLTNRLSYLAVPSYFNMIPNREEKTIVLCGNKTDVANRVVQPRQITIHRNMNCSYYDISAKSNYNFEKPFLLLARKLMQQPTLQFVEQAAVAPPVIGIRTRSDHV